MNKLIYLALFLCIQLTAYAQDAQKVFEQYTADKKYIVDGNSIVVSKIIEGINGSREDIYTAAKSYFARAYGDSNAVIQTDDKEKGLIIGKGLYANIASFSLGAWTIKAYHILRVDIKEGRARIICSASTMIPNSSAHLDNKYEYAIVDNVPLTDAKLSYVPKNTRIKAFISLVDRMTNSVDALGEALKGGGVLESEKEDW